MDSFLLCPPLALCLEDPAPVPLPPLPPEEETTAEEADLTEGGALERTRKKNKMRENSWTPKNVHRYKKGF